MEYPVQIGQRLQVEILRAGDNGRGIAVQNGLTLFVDQALPGEIAEIEITGIFPRYALAKTIEVLRPASGRCIPRCPHFGRCGGCSMQFMDHRTHGELLTENVRQLMQRVGEQKGFELLPILDMEDPWRYRNKAVFRAGMADGQPVLGFVARGSHAVVPVWDCLLQTEEAAVAARSVQDWMRRNRIMPYNEKTGRGILKHVMVRTNPQGQSMVVPVTAGKKLPAAEDLIQSLRAALPELVSVVQNINPRRTQEILGRECLTLWGEDRLPDTLMGLSFHLSPLSFYQVNRVMTEKLYAQVLELADLHGGEEVVDAYCGAGTIGLCLAARAGRVTGIEIVPEAIADARENARRNHVGNAEFLVGACENVLPRLVADGLHPDVIVLDPPRRGCEEAVLHAAAQSAPKRIVYVSCNPATLARDAKRLSALGYVPKKLRPVDMFPWTGETESVCLFVPKNSVTHSSVDVEEFVQDRQG